MGRRAIYSETGGIKEISCVGCGGLYPSTGLPHLCQTCGGLFDFRNPLTFNPTLVDRSQPGIWRYRHTFGLPTESEPVSLGEGDTPLAWATVLNREVAFKCEYFNPSGSFKDRGSSVIATWLKSRNIREAVEDSSGNAGASFAAYSARAGIKARIYVPESSSGPKRSQMEVYGADVVPVPGERSRAAEAVLAAVNERKIYASHAYLPFNIPGYATMAFEIFEQLDGKIPGAVLVPAGQGGLLLGLWRGFCALRIANNIKDIRPKIIGVQSKACAPLWIEYSGTEEDIPVRSTIAEGVQVRYPIRKDAVIQAVKASRGCISAVEEEDIIPGRNSLRKLGFYVEPTSAIVWAVLEKIIHQLPDPVVVILTGSGLKQETNHIRIN